MNSIRRTVALTSAVAVLALPSAAMAMPAPETGYHTPRGPVGPIQSTAASNGSSSDSGTLAIVLASGACAIALGGVAYSVKLGGAQRLGAR